MEICAAGVDTWSATWYLDPHSSAGRKMAALATIPSKQGASLIPEKIAGYRVGWYLDHGLVFADGHPGGDRLGAPEGLPAALRDLEVAMLTAQVPIDTRERPFDSLGRQSSGRAGIRRLDVTCDLAFEEGAEGLAVLAGVAGLLRDSPGKCDVFFGERGAVETVYLRGAAGRKVLGRWYDKGVESNTAARGKLIRPEDQNRWPKASRRHVEELTAPYVRDRFRSRFRTLYSATKGVTVGGPRVLADKLVAAVERGDITAARAEHLAGYLLLGDRLQRPARTRRRLRAQARVHGLVLADGVMQEVEVDLHDVLDQVMETELWGQG